MDLRDFAGQFSDVFKKLSFLQRVSIISAMVAIIFSAIALVLWANKPVYEILYANLEEDDVKAVIDKLEEDDIPYQIDGENTVKIPEDEIYRTRLEMAQEGLPEVSGTGFELFDRSSFGMTEFMQNVNYQRALQGELARTISSIDEIDLARVHLTIPKDRLFISAETEAKAAVVIKFKRNAEITRDQIKSIAFLISGSVKGLKPENVQVVDTAGRLLSEFMTDENAPLMLTQTQLEYQNKVEGLLEKKIFELLTSTLGPGNAVAKVTTEMNYDKKEITSEHFDPDPVLRSRQAIEISSISTALPPQGIPGVEPNLAEPDLFAERVKSEYNKTDDTQNYEVGRTVTSEKKAIGNIKRLTVAVVINDKQSIVEESGKRKIAYVERSQSELDRIKNLVAMTVGLNEARGDQIQVSNIPFDVTVGLDDLYMLEDSRAKIISTIIRYIAALFLILLFYLIVIRPIYKRLSPDKSSEGTVGEELDLTLSEEGIELPKSVEDIEEELADSEGMDMDLETANVKAMLKRLRAAIDEDPASVASLVNAWLKGA